MRITKLMLENFRSFKEIQEIDFGPVTLLFGPNSVGKSTVLMALFYVHHILAKGDCNPLRMENLGDKYVGGFKGLVHGRDISRTIRLGVEYAKGDSVGASYSALRDLLNEDGIDDIDWLFSLPDASGSVEHVGMEISIDWSEQRMLAYVSKCVVKLDKIEFATLVSSTGGQQAFIESVNYLHPILVGDTHDEWLDQCLDSGRSIHSENSIRVFLSKGLELPGKAPRDIGVNKSEGDYPIIEDVAFSSAFHEALNRDRIPEAEFNNASYMSIANGIGFVHAPIAFKNSIGALPATGKALDTTLEFESKKEGALIVEVLSDAIVPVFDNLLALLGGSICIGPLRAIPDPTYQPNPVPETKDWYRGLAAWDYLETADVPFLLKVDSWMCDEFSLGYGLLIKLEKSFSEFGSLSSTQKNDQLGDRLNSVILGCLSDEKPPDAFSSSSIVKKYAIWDASNHIEVSACDIGAGVSQILPFIVAALSRTRGFVSIEQPELHVHPRIQVAIGDLLTQANRNIGFLVETHSEHLILRLLKRIRQTTEGELPKGLKAVTKEDVSIVYLEPSDSGARSMRIYLDDDGEFRQRWPNGFFAERSEELF